jgi:cytochrome c peroxidase
MNKGVIVLGLVGYIILIASCKKDDPEPAPSAPTPSGGPSAPVLPEVPFDYASVELPPYIAAFLLTQPDVDNTPPSNPITNAGATLGRVLFYDKQLSIDNTTSCSSCHHQDKAFTDGLPLSQGHAGGLTRRNAMSPVNARYFLAEKMLWDLRAADLETQALIPLTDQIEMGLPSLSYLETKLSGLSYYPGLFEDAFGDPAITSERVAMAIAQFVRSIVSFNSRYDQGVANGFAEFTPQELAGKQIFISSFCAECHSDLGSLGAGQPATFLIVENTGQNFGLGSNNGLDLEYADNGIGEITGLSTDMGTFKIPALRNVELTAPYMHDGRFATLEEVLVHYTSGIQAHPNRGIQMPTGGVGFTPDQQAAVIAFLKTLTDEDLATEVKYSDPFPH